MSASSARRRRPCDELSAGQVGYFMAQIKNARRRPHRRHRDRRAATRRPTALPGYKEPKPMVFSGLYPVNNNDFETLREALAKLQLNDSSFTYQPEISEGLGFGFRCGFLGMLHREIIQQRLERDSELDLVQTAPNVTYEILTRKGETHRHRQPAEGAGRRPDRGVPRAVRAHQLPAAGREHRRPDAAVYRAPRHLRPHRIPQPDAGHPGLRDAAGGGHLRPVRQAEVGDARLRHDGLRLPRLPRRPTWCGSTSWCTQARRCPVHDRASRRSPIGAAASW